MIIELSNGKDRLFQWDKGQKVKISGDIPTVHFKWGDEGVPFEVVDGWVEIAPELTQKPGDILLWTYKEDHTLDAAKIPVERRPKPSDYVYTPTEIKTWEQLDERIKALEAANVQANWDQNDASAADYVRGRTHYVGTKHDVRVIKQTSGKFSPELGLIVGNTYRVDYDRGSGFGVGEEFVCKDLNEGKDGIEPAPYVGHANGNGNPDPYLIFDNSIDILPAFDHMVNIKGWKIEGDFASVKTLDLKYIDPKLLERIKALEDGGGVAGVSSVNGQTGAVEITAKGLGALTEDDLQSATNAALAQAKASGEFDGAPGAEGPQGPQGDTGANGKSINWRGEYSQTTQYSYLDSVSYEGSSYIFSSDTPTTGAVPGIDDAEWRLMAKKGDTGPQGPAGAGLDVTGATVGQTVRISAVDDNGVPTAWVPVDMASGGGEREWVKLYDDTTTITDEVSAIEVDILRSDTAKKFQIWLSFSANEATDWGSNKYITANINGASVCYTNFITTRLNSAFEVFFQVNCEGYISTYAVSGNVRIQYNRYPLYFQGWGDPQRNNGKLQIKFGAPYKGTMNALVWGEY